jgi:hypothetical protein
VCYELSPYEAATGTKFVAGNDDGWEEREDGMYSTYNMEKSV